MSNIYKYKNCLMLNIWNLHLNDNVPEINGHVKCVFNIITTQFRIWVRPKCIDGVWTKLTEVKTYSEKTRQYIIKAVYDRARQNCNERNPYGVWDISEDVKRFGLQSYHIDCFYFLYDNYIGNIQNKTTKMPNQLEAYNDYLQANLSPRIKVTVPYIDPYYMQRFKRINR